MRTILFTIVQQIKNISILLSTIIKNYDKKVINTMNLDKKNL